MLASSFSPRIWVFSLESKELIKLRSFLLFSLAENFLLIMNISWILLNKFCRTHWKDHMVFSGLEPRVSISKLFLCCWKKNSLLGHDILLREAATFCLLIFHLRLLFISIIWILPSFTTLYTLLYYPCLIFISSRIFY